MPKGEPKTEEEAQEMKRFLEKGAKTSIESLRRATSQATAKLAPAQPAFIDIPASASLLEALGVARPDPNATTQDVLLVELEVQPFTVVPSFSVNVFLNNRGANERTSTDDPSFVGSVSFFCHAELRDGELVCVKHDEEPTVFRLRVPTEALEAAGRGALAVTLVPVPFEGRKASPPLDVKATLEVIRSEFTRPT